MEPKMTAEELKAWVLENLKEGTVIEVEFIKDEEEIK